MRTAKRKPCSAWCYRNGEREYCDGYVRASKGGTPEHKHSEIGITYAEYFKRMEDFKQLMNT